MNLSPGLFAGLMLQVRRSFRSMHATNMMERSSRSRDRIQRKVQILARLRLRPPKLRLARLQA